ncbi:flavin reductase family protein [Agaribacter flavus]|uniref:Flavin reductase family protein n=1 Tax=Agaribacter flavus TaxID=1902781 RepID=A0ABV7FIV8_9ALTE
MIIDFTAYTSSERYHLMTQTLIPRPIAWALTASDLSGDKILNLAPFSYFTAVSSEPALMMISVGKKPSGENKDTLSNVLENKKIVIHIASSAQAALVTQTAATLELGESEISMIRSQGTGKELSTADFDGFDLPRLADCDIAYACELFEVKHIENASQVLIFVEIKQVYINADSTSRDDKQRLKIHADKIAPLARLGANEYTGITSPFTVQRPK